MKKMKVCWISNTPSPYKVAFMDLLGQKTDLLCLFESRAEKDRESSWYNYETRNFKAVYLDKNNRRRVLKEAAAGYDLLINSDYSQPVCMYATYLFHKYKKKVYIHADGGLAVPRGFIDKIISFVMKRADEYLSSGKEVNKYFNYYGIKDEKIRNYRFAAMSEQEITNAAQMRAEKEKYRERCEYKEEVIFLSVGQQIPRKGYDILVQAAVGLPENIGFYIVGGKPEENVLKIVRENKLKNIHFVPFLHKEELAEYYAGADVFVLPTRYDIWGLVINEAMAFGLPVLSTDHCVAALEFDRLYKNCVNVPIEDVQKLREAILTLAEDEELRNTLGRRSLEGIRDWSLEQMCEDFAQILNA